MARGKQTMKQVTEFDRVRQFMAAMEQDVDAPLTVELLEFRRDLLKEEYKEAWDEFNNAIAELNEHGHVTPKTLKALTAELADVKVVANGAAVTFGLPLECVYNRVMDANMRKLGPDGRPIKRADGKALKPEGWEPASFDDLFPEVV